MNQLSRPTRILLLETDAELSSPLQQLLQTKENLKLFHTISVSHLSEAFREMDSAHPDIIIMDMDPEDDPELPALMRLHQYAPQAPIVALLADRHQAHALKVLEKGADDYLLAGQIHSETLPAFFLRTQKRHASHKAVKESEERFRMMVEHASDVILILDHAGVITYAGPSTQQVLKVDANHIMGKNMLDFIHRDDRNGFLDSFEKSFAGGGESRHSRMSLSGIHAPSTEGLRLDSRTDSLTSIIRYVPWGRFRGNDAFAGGGALPFVQFRFRQSENHWIHMEGKGRVVMNGAGQRVCILNSHDVTHRVKLEEELRSLSLRDELTGLHNRRSFVACFEQQLKQAQRAKKKGVSLLFIDLDGFKGINDTLGHKEGDRALVEAARLLKTTFRDADIIARLGGDEFVVFLSDGVETLHVDSLKQRLTDSLAGWNAQENRRYRLSMSVGVIHHDPNERKTPEELLNRADELMYKQKRAKARQTSVPAGTLTQ